MRPLAAVLLLLASCGSPPPPAPTAAEERILRPMPDAPEEIRGFVERGDDFFLRASAAQRQGDVDAALDLYLKARTSFLEAQSRYPSLTPVPAPLIDRVHECVSRTAALQRQRHSH